MKVLFLTQSTESGPASRYRVYQYIDYLNQNNIECTISSALPKTCYKLFYQSADIWKKILLLPVIFLRRLRDMFRVKNYDIVFIQREILAQCFPLFETIISKLNKKIIFDFDDAIFLIPPQRNKRLYVFRDKKAIERIIKLSAQIIAGNDYLKQYAQQFSDHVSVIPTAVDTRKWKKADKISDKENIDNKKIIIGWIGTRHNLFYLESLKSVLEKLSLEYDICLHVISDADFEINNVEVKNIAWNMDTEVEQVGKFDIGIAPLFEDDWAKGKCGLKALQYMACSVATVCSAAGEYNQIVEDGQNGFLASNDAEWIEKLARLINDPSLRENLGKAGRKTIEAKYSLEINQLKLKKIIERLKQ
ncbi:MAG: glycosyltransferase family 4 protein [Candidatus Omnitrophota bacterium]